MAEQPTLVLLHGLGANRHVWDPLISALQSGTPKWDARIVAPDLLGHGGAQWRSHYSFGAMAADVAELLTDQPHGEQQVERSAPHGHSPVAPAPHAHTPYVVVGHSMGAIVGLALASGWFGPPPTVAATIGIKLRWSAEELARMPDLAARPPRKFDGRDGAVDWFMKLAGLYGVFDADDERIERTIEAGITRTDLSSPAVGWSTAQDPQTIEVGAPDLDGLLAAARCPVYMALGENDPLVAPNHHADLATAAASNPHASEVTSPHVFAGLGHNAMIEDAAAVAAWLAEITAN